MKITILLSNVLLQALLIALTSLTCTYALAQGAATVTRNIASYTQDVFPYKGSRMMSVDEVSAGGVEDNVFIFSKVEKFAKPDVMYFQRFTREFGKTGTPWKLAASSEIRHDGIIVVVNNRKTFTDSDKSNSIDALFIYALNDADLKQQSIHALFSHADKIYSIAASKADNYAASQFSDNFKDLSPTIKAGVMAYWNKLDKKDK
jgi:hypothetical protein